MSLAMTRTGIEMKSCLAGVVGLTGASVPAQRQKLGSGSVCALACWLGSEGICLLV